MSRLDDLKRSPLFQNVSEDAVLEALKVVAEQHFTPGELLVEQDREGEVLHLLTTGAVRVSRVSLGSRERVLGDLYAPGVLGETAVLARQERSATVRALTPVRTLALHRDHFELILRRHPRVLWNLAEMLARRVTFLNDELIAFGLNTEAALAHVFAGLYAQRVAAGVPDPEVLPLTTHDIMGRASSSRETVARVLRKMEAAGAVRVSTQTVTLLDLEELESIALQAAEVD
ncbi:Crp/Fnr family transcriptional regulator [Deinococcus hopiensis]|uniref:cAMP-binding domain of CRP or a regulatory subunit of cAMP-dependent protein kinases n=1 Tax=Deinococcus hopiensis KR-140 TaxID=695939 RepID=A0A1W1VG04_9DEIO|nr:Crp/Fnr family transcriptional regulator [Deinococcus hopiensis]SMB91894.1 cAMP-binding domain of CRP or a regulatory subunit of cAMP-dependent protein kinases [Deinococcus hopiensis KR-140]